MWWRSKGWEEKNQWGKSEGRNLIINEKGIVKWCVTGTINDYRHVPPNTFLFFAKIFIDPPPFQLFQLYNPLITNPLQKLITNPLQKLITNPLQKLITNPLQK